MTNVKIIDAADATPPKRKSPAQIIIDSLNGEYETMKSMAARYEVNVETIRRLCKAVDGKGKPRVKAPSKAVQQGDLTIYLFTKQDVKEIDKYMDSKGYAIKES